GIRDRNVTGVQTCALPISPAAVTVNTDAGQCSATGVSLGVPAIADNCPGASYSSDAPASYPKGNTTVTWTVTDASGNTATASQRSEERRVGKECRARE